MKKMLALLMSGIMVLSLAACSGDTAKTPEELYDEAVAKSANLSAMDAEMDITMDMDMGGMTLGMTMTADMQTKKVSDTDVQMAMVMKTAILGQEVSIEEYFKDGNLYMNDGMGTKVMAPIDYSVVADSVQMNSATSRDFMDHLEMIEQEGNYVFNYTISTDKLDDYLASAMGDMEEMLGDTGSYTISEMSGQCIVDKDLNVLSDNVHMVMDMTMEGQTMSIAMDLGIKYNAIGDDVVVNFPEDLDSYTEVDPEMLAGAMA